MYLRAEKIGHGNAKGSGRNFGFFGQKERQSGLETAPWPTGGASQIPPLGGVGSPNFWNPSGWIENAPSPARENHKRYYLGAHADRGNFDSALANGRSIFRGRIRQADAFDHLALYSAVDAHAHRFTLPNPLPSHAPLLDRRAR